MKCTSCLSILTLVVHVTGNKECLREYQYVADDGSCQQCDMCPPGYEPTPHLCGYGKKDKRYSCKPCDAGSFSSTTDYNLCRTCSPCERWNALTSFECTSTSNSVCGTCHLGYYRPQKADGGSDTECHKCLDSSNSSCQSLDWNLIIIILSVVSGILLLAAVIFGYLLRKAKKKVAAQRKPSETPSTKTYERQLVVSCSPTLNTSCELLSSSNKSLQQNQLQHPLIAMDPDTYSNRPTAEFQQSQGYSQLPTAQFHSNINQGGRSTAALSRFESVDHLRRNVDIFDTSSINNHSSLPLIEV